MLQWMREQARGVVGWTIISVIVLVLSVFGFGAFNFFVTSEPVVAEVGNAKITQLRYQGLVERQRRMNLEQLGDDADPSLIDEEQLRADVLEGLIERTLLVEGARRAGMGVPAATLDEAIIATPDFQRDGRFDSERFRILLASAGYTPVSYREALAEDLLVEQLALAVSDSSFVTRQEFEAIAALTGEERDVAWLAFEAKDYVSSIELGEDEVRAYFDLAVGRYQTSEQITVEYLRLELAALAAAEEVTDEALAEAYAEEVAAFEAQEQRRSSHILFAIDDERDEDTALALAGEVRERLLAGEDFAALAQEYSDDPGSASRGGDLGLAVRGAFVPPFERALFDLEVGSLSEPVVSQFGVHLIRLEEIARTEPPSLESQRPMLEQGIRDQAARTRFDEQHAQLETLAYEAPDLSEPAEALGLEVQTAGPFTRAGGDGDFALPLVLEAAFSDEVLVDGYNSSLLEPQDDVVLVLRVLEHIPERLQDFAEVSEAVREELALERAREQATRDADLVLERLREGAAASGVAAEFGREWTRIDAMKRNNSEAPGPVLTEAFAAARPAEGGRSLMRAELEAEGVAIVIVTGVRPGDHAALTEAERTQLEQILRQRQGGAELNTFRAALRRDLGVSQRRVDDL